MTDTAQPKPRHFAARTLLLVSAGIVAILALALFVAFWVVPVVQTCRAVNEAAAVGRNYACAYAVDDLGGPKRAAECLSTYLRLPAWIATDKGMAVNILGHYGENSIPLLEKMLEHPDPEMRWRAVWALREVADSSASAQVEAFRVLKKASDDSDEDVRRSVQEVLPAE